MDEPEIIFEDDQVKTNSILHHPNKEELGYNTMPEHIKKNFIYRKVWSEVWQNDSNAQFIVIGKPGIGKSVIAQKACLDLDPTFSHERICYSIDDFLKLLTDGDSNGQLHPGNCILFDEIVTDRGADSRSALSKTNKLMNYINATFRAKRLIVFYCLPSLLQLDKNIRDINVTGIFEVIQKDTKKKKNLCKFQWSKYDARTQKVYYIFPRLVNKKGQIQKITGVWMGLPNKEFECQYKKKKMEYLNANLNRWRSDLTKDKDKKRVKGLLDSEIVSEVKSNPKAFMVGGKINALMIREKYGIGINRSDKISGMLNKSNKSGTFI